MTTVLSLFSNAYHDDIRRSIKRLSPSRSLRRTTNPTHFVDCANQSATCIFRQKVHSAQQQTTKGQRTRTTTQNLKEPAAASPVSSTTLAAHMNVNVLPRCPIICTTTKSSACYQPRMSAKRLAFITTAVSWHCTNRTLHTNSPVRTWLEEWPPSSGLLGRTFVATRW